MSNVSRPHRRPARLLPLLYFGLAHVALATAFLVVALEPEGVAGFYYHPRMVFVVHLVTLGWITSSILGTLYLVGPMALATPMPVGRGDYGHFALYLLGASGVIFHFAIGEFSGAGVSGILVGLAVLRIGLKFLLALAESGVPGAVKLHFVLAFANLGLAVLLGVALAFNKLVSVLPGYVLSNVAAHAHLAALGWATMMVMGAGYRLLPMFLPSAMPPRRAVLAGALVFEAGVLGLAASLFARSSWSGAFALLAAAGVGIFFALVVWMKRHPRRPAKGIPRPDPGVAQTLFALACLAAATVLGLVLAVAPQTETTLRLVLVYGVLGLVGFLAQMVVGIGQRLLPLYAWLSAFTAEPPPVSPHALPDRRLQAVTFVLWVLGVPALAAGLFLDLTVVVRIGGVLLLAAVLAGGSHNVRILHSLASSDFRHGVDGS